MVKYKKMKKAQICLKKDVKKCWQVEGGVVLYLSAKRWAKEWLLEAEHEAFEKNQWTSESSS